MSMVDVFSSDAFGLVSLTEAIRTLPYKPQRIGALGIFADKGISTTTAVIEAKGGILTLLQTAARGAPGQVAHVDKRTVRNFTNPHIPHSDAIPADAVQDVRAFGSSDTTEGVAAVVNDRLTLMKERHEVTLEHLRAGAIQGIILDADLSVLYNLFTEYSITQTSIDFLLGTSGTKERKKCLAVSRKIELALGAAFYDHIHVLCGETWFDRFISHSDVETAYARFNDGEMLRNDPRSGFAFGGLIFEEYRGKVGNNSFIDTNQARAFPIGVPDLFPNYYAPANYVETVNTIGLPIYAKQKMMDFEKGVLLETQSNPLPMCTRPGALIKLTTSD